MRADRGYFCFPEEDAVSRAAINMLAPLGGKDPGTLGAIKNTMFATAVAALTVGS